MNMTHRRSRYKHCSLITESRKTSPDVWVVRWFDSNGARCKATLGTVKELSKTQAQKKANEYRRLANTPQQPGVDSSLTVADLVKHYKERELGDDSGKATKPRKAYLYIFASYILPKWGSLLLGQVKAVAVEDWLKTLPLANGSKAKVREVFGAAFRHAMRYELFPKNPIANVRQVRKRAVEPEILDPAEIAAIIKQLEGVEPVRTAFLIAAVMGMRRGEIFGLQWKDIDLERAVLHVRRSFVDGVEGLPVVEALSVWKKQSKYTEPGHWVFASEFHFGKQPLWPATLWRRNVAPAIQAAEINKPKLGWHTLRRSYAFPAPLKRSKFASQYGANATLHCGDDAGNIRADDRGLKARGRS